MQSYRRNNTTIYVVNEQQEEVISLEMFGLSAHIPTLTLVGDTKYTEPQMERLRPFFKKLAAAVTQPNLPTAIIDGATNFGVMRLFGEAFSQVWEQRNEEPTPLIGATLRKAIEEDRMPLEAHHSSVLLAPGDRGEWIKAVPWLRRVQVAIAGENPSVLLAVGGGIVTLQHMREHTMAGTTLYVLQEGGDLGKGFVEAQKEIGTCAGEREPYPYSIEEHKSLLTDANVILLDLTRPQDAIDQLKHALYKTQIEAPDESGYLLVGY